MSDLAAEVRDGSRRALAKAITQVERGNHELVAALYPHTGNAHVVGITGSPGSGKSTLVNELAKAFRRQDLLVGIIAVDPSSPFSGGALLGDRIRMRDLSGDPGIFIRSMATRGSLGGLARATAAVVKLLDAAGFDIILVETVGAGQAEVDIANTAHTTIVVEAPGMGDEIQSIKAGILEIADLLVVNKADHPGARNTVKALRMMLNMGQGTTVRHHGRLLGVPASGAAGAGGDGTWQVDVYETVATSGEGVVAVVQAIGDHRDYLRSSGEWAEREGDRSRQEITQLLQARLIDRLEATVPAAERDRLVAAVAAREMDPYAAVEQLFSRMALVAQQDVNA
ncbi:MAG: methylmalonyl Co-A mutase-associated GTPase MeaB [Anaerolineae bacterium]|nr:methylmalonyl Co-A mutase-associated GTPase MeaB [Anaerolineae bacterium]